MLMNSNEYLHIVESIKQEIRTAQYRAAISVNRELLILYHSIGEVINAHKTWGSKFVENLAADIKLSFPDATGYSARNLKYMAKFAAAYPDDEFVQRPVAQIPWGHNVVLLDKLSGLEERLWYAERSAENGWSRNVLVHQIESGLYQRQVLAEKVSNFEKRLPSPQSELAAQTMKDPYIFDFIPFKADMVERDIEQALVKDVTKLLLELGTGFAFLGNQYHLNVGGDDFYIDLLFYNLNLRCYVVIELKTGEFKPRVRRTTELLPLSGGWHSEERTGQSFYWLVALQEQERSCGGILPQGHEQAHRRQRLPDHQQPAGRAGTPIAICGGYPEADQGCERVML